MFQAMGTPNLRALEPEGLARKAILRVANVAGRAALGE